MAAATTCVCPSCFEDFSSKALFRSCLLQPTRDVCEPCHLTQQRVAFTAGSKAMKKLMSLKITESDGWTDTVPGMVNPLTLETMTMAQLFSENVEISWSGRMYDMSCLDRALTGYPFCYVDPPTQTTI